MSISEHTILVTGAAGCLGSALARRLTALGARVAAVDLDSAGLDKLQTELPDLVPRVCDLTDGEAVERAVDGIVEQMGGITAVVNNAGQIQSAPLLNPLSRDQRRHSVELWDHVIAVNLTSVFLVTRCVADHMAKKRTKGVIVNISSIAAAGNAGQSAYGAAKAGINALTVTWAKELGPLGIRVLGVAPGFVDTPSTRAALTPKVVEHLEQQVPLRRLGRDEEFVSAVESCLSNTYLNGVVLPVDGGLRI
jgi:3-oxoacyl-[acyl-carrier protein] reductase